MANAASAGVISMLFGAGVGVSTSNVGSPQQISSGGLPRPTAIVPDCIPILASVAMRKISRNECSLRVLYLRGNCFRFGVYRRYPNQRADRPSGGRHVTRMGPRGAGAQTPVGGPILRMPMVRRLGRWLVSPIAAWMAMNLVFLGWYPPAAFDFALDHERWHEFEHLTFVAGSILFWWSILQPWPASKRGSGWELVFSLISVDLVTTVLSAFLAFCGRSVYPYYRSSPFPVSPLSDQIMGAVIMWVLGSFAFLLPATLITFRLLQRNGDNDSR